MLTPIAKDMSPTGPGKSTATAMQVYGGYGYTQEYPVEQLLRDCRIFHDL
jgi:alkylation response protein AidB-like acyl-CoA dehydrogenase